MRNSPYTLIGCSILVIAARTSRAQPVQSLTHNATSLERRDKAAPESSADERGMSTQSIPLTPQIRIHIHGVIEGILHDGDTVMSGDRIQVVAKSNEDAHLYLAYCTAERELTVFPTYGNIPLPAGSPTVAPDKEASLVLDDHLGTEALYVILSRTDLASADPRLAAAIKGSQPGDPAANCGPHFQMAMATSSPMKRPSATRATPAPPGTDASTMSRRGKSGTGTPTEHPRGPLHPDDGEPPLVTIERGMSVDQDGLTGVTASTDANGIAILHYHFRHVAATR